MDKSRGYSLEGDLTPIIKGDLPLPNFKTDEAARVIDNIAALGHGLTPKWGYANIDGDKRWAQYFLTPAGMGGRLDGGGYILIYGGYPNGGRVGTFAICQHEKQDAAGADHQRGWHPGACKKCGLDMTVDSGD